MWVVALWAVTIFTFVLCRWAEVYARKRAHQAFLESDYWTYMEVVKAARFCQVMIVIITIMLCLVNILVEIN